MRQGKQRVFQQGVGSDGAPMPCALPPVPKPSLSAPTNGNGYSAMPFQMSAITSVVILPWPS